MATECVSVDFSLNSTGVTIYNCDTKVYRFLSFVNVYKDKKTKKIADDIINSVTVFKYNRPPIKAVKSQKKGLTGWEQDHIINCITFNKYLSDFICDNIKLNNKNLLILENYSYGSPTNTLIQLIENTMELKSNLLKSKFFSTEDIFLVTAPQVKKFAGNGNFDKYDLLQALISLRDENIIHNDYYKLLCSNIQNFVSKKNKKGKEIFEVVTPINDINDSFWINKYFQEEFKTFI